MTLTRGWHVLASDKIGRNSVWKWLSWISTLRKENWGWGQSRKVSSLFALLPYKATKAELYGYMRISIFYHVYIVALNQCFVCRSLFGRCISLKTIGLLSYNGVLFSFLLSACRTQVAGEYTTKQGLGMKFQSIRATAKYLSFEIQLYRISSYITTTAQL